MSTAAIWFWRGFGTALLSAFVLLSGLFGMAVWYDNVDQQRYAREYLYARVLTEATARNAEPSTAKLLWTVSKPAPMETTGDIVPCPWDAATLRRSGAAGCHLFNFPGGDNDQPWYCGIAPCAALAIRDREWRDPAVRRAVAELRRKPRMVCDARASITNPGWRDDLADIVDCGPARAFRGFVLIAVVDDGPGSHLLRWERL